MPHDDDAISDLKVRIFQLEATLLLAETRAKAFRAFAIEVWQSQGVTAHATDSLATVLHRLELGEVSALIADYADTNPAMAAILKQHAEALFGPLPDTGTGDDEGEES